MTVEYVRYTIARRRAEGFRQAYEKAAAILQADPRCLSYEISQSLAEPTRFVVRIEWDSPSRRLEGVRKDPAYAHFFASLDPYADDIVETQSHVVQLVSPDVPEKGKPSLYEWAGGRPAVTRLINAFYDHVEADELLRRFFPQGWARRLGLGGRAAVPRLTRSMPDFATWGSATLEVIPTFPGAVP